MLGRFVVGNCIVGSLGLLLFPSILPVVLTSSVWYVSFSSDPSWWSIARAALREFAFLARCSGGTSRTALRFSWRVRGFVVRVPFSLGSGYFNFVSFFGVFNRIAGLGVVGYRFTVPVFVFEGVYGERGLPGVLVP